MKFLKGKGFFSKRKFIVLGFVLLVCVAAYADYNTGRKLDAQAGEYLYTSGGEAEKNKILGQATLVDNQQNSYDTYFSAMQIDRQRSRDEAMETLQTVIDSADSMPDVKEQAYSDMMTIANNITVESNVQSLVMAKGFRECVAVMGSDRINVIVATDGLLTNEVAQITEIAMKETGFSADKITIVEKGRQ